MDQPNQPPEKPKMPFGRKELNTQKNQPKSENVTPNFGAGEGTISEPYVKAYAYRKTRPTWIRPWEKWFGDSIATDDLVKMMTKTAQEYHDKLQKFAEEELAVVTSDSLIGSPQDLKDLIKMAMENIQHDGQNAKSKNHSPEERKQGFSMLAADMDVLQYLTWRLENPNQLRVGIGTLDVNGALVTNALEKFNQSLRENSKPDYRDLLIIQFAADECNNQIRVLPDLSNEQKEQNEEIRGNISKYALSATNVYFKERGASLYLSEEGIINQFKDFVANSNRLFQFRRDIEENRNLIDL